MILPITLTFAAAAALLNIWLAARIGGVRRAREIFIGDGGDDALIRRMRAQANFAEYTPFVLILMGLIELARGTSLWLWIVGALYIGARILHAFGMEGREAGTLLGRFRLIGIAVTMLTLLGLAGYALAIPYLAPGTITSEVVPAG